MSKKLVDIANDIFTGELQETSETSVAAITTWLRGNIGTINNVLGTQYTLNTTTLEPNDSNGNILTDEVAGIYKYLYLLNYYERQIKACLGVGGIAITTQLTSDGGTIRFVDRTAAARIYQTLRKDTEETMRGLVNKYKLGNQTAVDVQGDDQFVKQNIYEDDTSEAGIIYQRDIY